MIGNPSTQSNNLHSNSLYEGFRFYCASCPYVNNITHRISSKTVMKSKSVDDILGGAAAWENVDQTEAHCPKCSNKSAYFMQIQTRSADEPMTTFYKCTNWSCQNQWKEG
jgi:DNA-directed RNA polymerase III subunit RPC11